MTAPTLPLQVRLLCLQNTPETRASIDAAAAQIAPFSARIELCKLQLGRWISHHQAGHQYRAELAISLSGHEHTIEASSESALDAAPEALTETLQQAFESARRQLGHVLGNAQ
jgi:hypothetical protein